MAKPTTIITLAVGSRVRLRSAHNWLSRYASLAKNGRVGTVTRLPDERTAEVKFDTVRPSAKPIWSVFARDDLILRVVPPSAIQEALRV